MEILIRKDFPEGKGPVNKMDNLKELFELQKQLQKRLGNDISKFDLEFYKINHLALENELHEALRETPWKPWKKQQNLNIDKLKEELVDAWHFIINMSLCAQMDSNELYERFKSKNQINHKRQENEY